MSMNVRKATINVIRTPFVSTLLDPITVTVAKATTAPVINVQVMYIHHIINMPRPRDICCRDASEVCYCLVFNLMIYQFAVFPLTGSIKFLANEIKSRRTS